jgi:CHASE3 domain sensor protein
VFQKNLQVIDQAIGESRAALKTQPASTDVQEGLFENMRTKVALLQQTVELINEMRKGNQAEAGRIIQGLK